MPEKSSNWNEDILLSHEYLSCPDSDKERWVSGFDIAEITSVPNEDHDTMMMIPSL